MLVIQSVESLNDIKLNISRRKSIKTQIFLYDTQRRLDDFMMKLKYRNDGKYEDIPHYVISKSGRVFKIFDTDYSSKTFGTRDIDRKMVKIAIENLGWLNKNTITGVLYNWIGTHINRIPILKNGEIIIFGILILRNNLKQWFYYVRIYVRSIIYPIKQFHLKDT